MTKFLGLILIALMVIMGRTDENVVVTFTNMDSLHRVAVGSIVIVAAILFIFKLIMATDNTNHDDDDNDHKHYHNNHTTKSLKFKIETQEASDKSSYTAHMDFEPIIFYPQDFYVPEEKVEVPIEEPVIQVAEEVVHQYTAEELKAQILECMKYGRNLYRSVIEKLTELNSIEDTSEFLEEYPQVLAYVFNS